MLKYYGIIGLIVLMFTLSGCQKKTIPQQDTSAKSDGIVYSLSNAGVLEVKGSGKLTCENFSFYNDNGTDWDVIESIKKIIIKEGITHIGEDCFSGFSSVETVILPEGLKKINENAFSGNVMMKYINIPETVEVIENNAFEDCISLREFTLPSSLEKYKTNAIKGCYSLRKVVNRSSYTWKLCLKRMYGTWYCNNSRVKKIDSGQEVRLQSERYKINYELNGGIVTKELPDQFVFREGVKLPDTVERKGYSFAGWDVGYELTDYIDEGTKGNQNVKAVWIDFQVENVKEGKIRAFWDLVDGGEEIKSYEGYSCHIRYSQNQDMSKFDFIRSSEKDVDVEIDKLEKGKRYYIEYAIIHDLDNWDTISDLPWQGKQSIMVQ